jgi:hypothetical protein
MAACGTDDPGGACKPGPCCDTVVFTTTDPVFIDLYFGDGSSTVSATYLRHPTQPTITDRPAYLWAAADYCLWYASSAWRMSSCANLGSSSYNIKSQDSQTQCPTQEGLEWRYWAGTNTVVPAEGSMNVSCNSTESVVTATVPGGGGMLVTVPATGLPTAGTTTTSSAAPGSPPAPAPAPCRPCREVTSGPAEVQGTYTLHQVCTLHPV